jgi:hypothetical protein
MDRERQQKSSVPTFSKHMGVCCQCIKENKKEKQSKCSFLYMAWCGATTHQPVGLGCSTSLCTKKLYSTILGRIRMFT